MVPCPIHHPYRPPSTDDLLQQVPFCCSINQHSLQEYEIAFYFPNPMFSTTIHSVATFFPICAVLYLCIQHCHDPFYGLRILYSWVPQATKRMVGYDTSTGEPQRHKIRRPSLSSYDLIDGETDSIDGQWGPIPFQSRLVLSSKE